jgi:hypothetical protein
MNPQITFHAMTLLLPQWLLVLALGWNGVWISADRLGNFYAVDERGAIVKIDSSGQAMFRYQRTGGMPQAVDATNPLKLVVHYPASNTVVFLDNTLSAIGTLDLLQLGYVDATAVCFASDDRLWVYDASLRRLHKLENNGTLYREGADLTQHTNTQLNVTFMRENNQRVFLNDPTYGVVVTDAYGNYERTLSLKGLDQFQFANEQLVYTDSLHMLFYDLRTNAVDTVSLQDVAPFHRAVYTNEHLLALRENGLSLYRRTSP